MDQHRGYRSQARPSKKIYISNLSMDAGEDELRKAFSDFGTIEDITVKSKDSGIVFAFILYDSEDAAQQAIKAMNQKDFFNKEIKVEFAKGPRDRGDRGGYRGRGDFERRPPRDFGDRPKGCFNCGEEGHFARQCSKPRKPREYNNDRGGGYRGGRDYDRDKDRNREKERRRRDDSRSRSRSRSHDRKRKHRRRSSSGSY